MLTSNILLDSVGREIKEGQFCSRYNMGMWSPDWIVYEIDYEEQIVTLFREDAAQHLVGSFSDDIRMDRNQ